MSHTGFHHEAFFYADADEFLAGAVPFLRDGLEAGEAAMVAVTRARAEELQAELNGASEQIRFEEMEALGRNPARIIPAWRRFVDEHGGSDRPIRGIGEPVWPRRTSAEIDECQRHELLLNYAFWDGPAWRLLCPYDSAGLDDDVLEAAHRSHALVCGSAASPEEGIGEALDPEAVAPFAGALLSRPAGATRFDFEQAALHEARALVAAEAGRAGLSSDRVFDLVATVGELTANSVMHGGGEGVLQRLARGRRPGGRGRGSRPDRGAPHRAGAPDGLAGGRSRPLDGPPPLRPGAGSLRPGRDHGTGTDGLGLIGLTAAGPARWYSEAKGFRRVWTYPSVRVTVFSVINAADAGGEWAGSRYPSA